MTDAMYGRKEYPCAIGEVDERNVWNERQRDRRQRKQGVSGETCGEIPPYLTVTTKEKVRGAATRDKRRTPVRKAEIELRTDSEARLQGRREDGGRKSVIGKGTHRWKMRWDPRHLSEWERHSTTEGNSRSQFEERALSARHEKAAQERTRNSQLSRKSVCRQDWCDAAMVEDGIEKRQVEQPTS